MLEPRTAFAQVRSQALDRALLGRWRVLRVGDLTCSLPLREGERLAEVRFYRLELASAVGRATAAPSVAKVAEVTYTSSEA